MKKLILALMSALLLVGCGTGATNAPGVNEQSSSNNGDPISVVTTIFPEYDWVKQIVGDSDSVEVTMLLDNGVDLHNYQPSADDIMKVATCDVFIYVGGESDEWVEDALKEAVNPDMQVINLMDVLGESVKEEEVVEGMEAEEEEESAKEEEVEYDEHVWLSLKNAKVLVNAIADTMETVDAANADVYKANAEAYVSELDDLDAQYDEVVRGATANTVLFGDRFPFRYLVDDYGLNYYAAFVGCSAETEASFETITFLADKVDELGLNAIFTIENSDQKIAETIIANTDSKDAKILSMDSMQSTTSDDVANGVTYLSIMESNLEVLAQGIN
ncbi:metal ABC transporter substrate-binding protein [Pseudobutyrivibrio sp. MD2005]|uniref:metal ABC transporter substrate-binding protein n=1 Tax=Pseudobutyrivibrio sp. MD2005 TaxID=1410616 RepID=UPI00048561AA|nr:metal ABC transporter substrate-binding protein [Pseudobutyrivibrio sp. MD2005]